MINVSTITTALKTLLDSNATIAAWPLAMPVVRGDYINEDAGLTPWIGIYRGEINLEPRTLGMTPNNLEATALIKIVVQQSSADSSSACETLLEGRVHDVLSAIMSDTSIGGTVDMVNRFKVSHGYIETESTSLYFQTAIIELEAEVSA